MKWTPQEFRFDELDIHSACLPYAPASVELPGAAWGRTLRVECRLLTPDLPYKPRWIPPAQVRTCDNLWQTFFRVLGMTRLKDWLESWMSRWPKISRVPELELGLDDKTILRHRPSPPESVVEVSMPVRPEGRESFKLSFRLQCVGTAEFLGKIGKLLLAVPMPLALWNRMRDWQFRSLQHRRLRLVTVSMDGRLILDFREHSVSPGPSVRKLARPGLNIVGHFLSEHSIGDAARGSVKAADAAGIPACLLRLRTPLTCAQGDNSVKARLADNVIHGASLFHINVREAGEIERHHGTGLMSGRHNIAYWAWETCEFPEDWIRFARGFQEIWSPSQFAATAIQMRVGVPVLTMPHVIEFPVPSGAGFRAKFGLPERMFLFLYVFDLNSLAARKNPGAVVEAFRRVAATQPAAGLVLKTHNASRNAADMASLLDQVAGLPNVFIIDRTLARHEVYELMAGCDAFVSLHHAEGFGLCVAEAMFLGKPVVSTDWSATAEYVTAQNGFPVRHRLVRLSDHVDEYVRGTEWAEPEVEHAAWCMNRLMADAQLCAALGAQAARDIRERFSAAAVGRLYARRLESAFFW